MEGGEIRGQEERMDEEMEGESGEWRNGSRRGIGRRERRERKEELSNAWRESRTTRKEGGALKRRVREQSGYIAG